MPMHTIITSILLLIGSLGTPASPCKAEALPSLLSKADYQRMFPHHAPIYSYNALLKAASGFPDFAATGDLTTRKKELAAFLAQIAHETSNGGPGAPGGAFSWGLYYTEEKACSDGHCTQYNISGTSPYKPVAGKSYHGRGPLQLSYAYNYGLAGEELKLPLLEKPELVSSDGTVAFTVALWFWMRAQKPKPSCHDVMTGSWHPSPEDIRLNRKPGFGMTINIINGALECNSTKPENIALQQERVDFYHHFTTILHVQPEADCGCTTMKPYGN